MQLPAAVTFSLQLDHHAHLDDPDVDLGELTAALLDLTANGWPGAVVPGYGPERHPRIRQLLQHVPTLTRAVGLHPEVLAALPDEPARQLAWQQTVAELEQPKVVALGELGLDRRFKEAFPLDLQLAWLQRGLDLARERNLPVVLHVVGWHGHALQKLKPFAPLRGVVHRWSGPVELVRGYQDAGLHLSLALEPRENVERRRETARAIATDRLLIETDWPFLGLTYPQALQAMAQLLETVAQWRGEASEILAARLARNVDAVYRSAPP